MTNIGWRLRISEPALIALLSLSALGACSTTRVSHPGPMTVLSPASGSSVRGTVLFTPEGDYVRVTARVSGLKPNQEHGFHVHERGDCSAPDATSAGGHFNPTSAPHGAQAEPHHGGDMPALKSDASGNANMSFLISGVTLDLSRTGVMGRGVIVHAMPDDYATQPTGNSGVRLACGVILAG